MNIKQILSVLIILSALLISGCVEHETHVKKYNVVEYDLGLQYFIFIDDNGNIIHISYDKTGWNNNAHIVEVIESNETYVNEITEYIGVMGVVNKYELYLNSSNIMDA